MRPQSDHARKGRTAAAAYSGAARSRGPKKSAMRGLIRAVRKVGEEKIEAWREASMWLSVVDRSQGERHSTTLVAPAWRAAEVLLCLLLGLPRRCTGLSG